MNTKRLTKCTLKTESEKAFVSLQQSPDFLNYFDKVLNRIDLQEGGIKYQIKLNKKRPQFRTLEKIVTKYGIEMEDEEEISYVRKQIKSDRTTSVEDEEQNYSSPLLPTLNNQSLHLEVKSTEPITLKSFQI